MPDRAVVDDDEIGFAPPHASRDVEFEVQRVAVGEPSAVGLPEPQPRALVALSEDRQWLVVLDKEPYEWQGARHRYFSVYGWDADESQYTFESTEAEHEAILRDTGQDAHDVLDAFLAGA